MYNKEDLLELSQRVMLDLSSEEMETVSADIANIMSLVQAIDDVDLSQFDCSDDVDISELRDDVVAPSLPVDVILGGTAERQDNFFTA